MKIKYNVKNLYEDRYVITWDQPMGNGTTVQQVTTFRSKEFSLEKFLSQAQNRISGFAAALRQKNPSIPKMTSGYRMYEWDGDISALPDCYKRQFVKRQQEFRMVQLDMPVEEKPREPELYEIAKQNGVWTIKKHEQELLTWEEACAELAKRIA